MSDLERFKEEMSITLYGISKSEAVKQNICIDCKQPPRFKTEAGRKEYPITGLCEYCFDKLFEENG